MAPQYRMVPAAKKATVLLVDDHPIVRQGLTQLINQEPDLAVCAQAEDANGAFQAIATQRPDVVVLDISLNGPDGLSVLKDIRLRHATLPVLVLSMHDESLYAERVLRAGANGYIMKQEATERVLEAIRQHPGRRNLCQRPDCQTAAETSDQQPRGRQGAHGSAVGP